jgi:hypothetical protein
MKQISFFAFVLVAIAWIVMVAPGAVLAGEMYKWTDADGVVHFSDIPPEGQQVPAQSVPAGKQPASASAYEAPGSEPSIAQQRREEIAAKSQETQAAKAMTEAQCETWRGDLAQLEPNRRVFFTNEEGQTERMDDVVRANRVAELKALIEQNCE